MITANELREKYLEFFLQHGHAHISGKSLIPENDPTVLFTTAGMHPLVPYILGQEHPAGSRLISCQKCIRTGDIEEVGDDSHFTFFEMLGNWSLGDYFKEEAIAMSYEFLCSDRWLGIPAKHVAISVFEGDDEVERDLQSMEYWKGHGFSDEQLHFLSREHNWWGPPGTTGPCGPDTEMFIDQMPHLPAADPSIGSRYCEIWNNVFMQYDKDEDGNYQPLSRPCVDTGMGVERTITILQGKKSAFETELFLPLMQAIVELSGVDSTGEYQQSIRIIADHLRAACFILGDDQGVRPSNLGAGYVLRRLIRRATRHLRKIGLGKPSLYKLVSAVLPVYASMYPELLERRELIEGELEREEKQFMQTLSKGEQEFNKLLPEFHRTGMVSGQQAFRLYDTFGFPIEISMELAREHGLSVDSDAFAEAFAKHQELSRSDQNVQSKGGLADHSDYTVCLHTATHLLQQALVDVLGEHVQQKGSHITAERLRFDFSHGEKLTDEECRRVEEIVNAQIARDLPVFAKTMSLEEARDMGARALFLDRYGEQVSVYCIGDYSIEVCAGPHVERTGRLGHFRIVKEQSSSQGVRRIKALLE